MITKAAERRAHAAALARRYFHERSVPLSTIEETFRDSRDPLIEELLDLATHEPPTNSSAYRKYWPHVEAVLDQLDLGDRGTLPPSGRWSLSKVLGLVATAVLFGTLAAIDLLNGSADDDFQGTRALIFAVISLAAFAFVLPQYLKERRRRSRTSTPL